MISSNLIHAFFHLVSPQLGDKLKAKNLFHLKAANDGYLPVTGYVALGLTSLDWYFKGLES